MRRVIDTFHITYFMCFQLQSDISFGKFDIFKQNESKKKESKQLFHKK